MDMLAGVHYLAARSPYKFHTLLVSNSLLKVCCPLCCNPSVHVICHLPDAFVACMQATPAADTAFFYFETNQLGFTPEFMGRIRLAGSIASLIGVSLPSCMLC